MSANLIEALDRTPFENSELKGMWGQLKPALETGKVASRGEAYLTFSRVLKISNGIGKDEEIRNLWQKLLEEGAFAIEGTDHKCDFKQVLRLFKEGKKKFEITWVPIDPKDADMEKVAKQFHAIIQEATPTEPPSFTFFQNYVAAPIAFGMMAQVESTPIACAYATHVEALNLVHFNFVGRKIDYPGIHILEKMQSQIDALLERFPDTKVLTLCVEENNTHAMSNYASLGFKEIQPVEKLSTGKPGYFYGKALEEGWKLPNYDTFKAAYTEAREPYLPKKS